jgi:hypothetical protein
MLFATLDKVLETASTLRTRCLGTKTDGDGGQDGTLAA